MGQYSLLQRHQNGFDQKTNKRKASNDYLHERKKRRMAFHSPGKHVYVGNISYTTTKQTLREHFSQYGDITDVFMVFGRNSGKNVGLCFVTFETEVAAEAATKERIQKIDGHNAVVELGKEKATAAPAAFELFVCDLNRSTKKDQIEQHFAQFGAVALVTLPYRSKMNAGYAFVQYENKESLERAISSQHKLDGKTVLVRRNRKDRMSRVKPREDNAAKLVNNNIEDDELVNEEEDEEEDEDEDVTDDKEVSGKGGDNSGTKVEQNSRKNYATVEEEVAEEMTENDVTNKMTEDTRTKRQKSKLNVEVLEEQDQEKEWKEEWQREENNQEDANNDDHSDASDESDNSDESDK